MDLVVPVAAYYLLRAASVSPLLALVVSAVPSMIFLAYQAIRRGKIDALGLFVVILLAVGVVISLFTGNPALPARKEWCKRQIRDVTTRSNFHP